MATYNRQAEGVMNRKPYQPSNGSEGCSFEAVMCDNCQYGHDNRCPIWMLAHVTEKDSEDYPSQLIYNEDGKPTCTAFSLMPEWALLKDKYPILTRTLDFQEIISEFDADTHPRIRVEINGSAGEYTFDIADILAEGETGSVVIAVERNF